MPLAKTADLLHKVRVAKMICKDPVSRAYLFSSEGMMEAAKAGLTEHPFMGLWLWAEAYQDPDMTRAITKATLAMTELHRALTKLPPKVWEKRLKDPKRSEQGYSIDTLYAGGCIPIEPEGARQMIRERLAAMANPPAPLPVPKPIESRHAWIKPDGTFEVVGFEQHISWLGNQEPPLEEGDVEEAGWVKISSGRVWLYKAPTQKQLDRLFDWCQHHDRPYDQLLAKVEDKDTFYPMYLDSWLI